jgi:phage FluMu protein Com
MPTPFPSRQAAPSSGTGAAKTKATTSNAEWRCTRCDKLLGVGQDGRMHLRFARGHEYFVGFPVVATCRGCKTLNQATAPVR